MGVVYRPWGICLYTCSTDPTAAVHTHIYNISVISLTRTLFSPPFFLYRPSNQAFYRQVSDSPIQHHHSSYHRYNNNYYYFDYDYHYSLTTTAVSARISFPLWPRISRIRLSAQQRKSFQVPPQMVMMAR